MVHYGPTYQIPLASRARTGLYTRLDTIIKSIMRKIFNVKNIAADIDFQADGNILLNIINPHTSSTNLNGIPGHMQFVITREDDRPSTAYRTPAILSDYGAYTICGRGNLVFKIELFEDGTLTGELSSLKDGWVHEDRMDEGDISAIEKVDAEGFSQHFLKITKHGHVRKKEDGNLVADRVSTPSIIDGPLFVLKLRLSEEPRDNLDTGQICSRYPSVYRTVKTALLDISTAAPESLHLSMTTVGKDFATRSRVRKS